MNKAGAHFYVAGRVDDTEKYLRRMEKSLTFEWTFSRDVLLNF